jgi:dolichol-phosphate mannosyltransferase
MKEEKKDTPSFLIALPMYNEETYAEKSVRSIFRVLEDIQIRNGIVAVNDGSRDNTLRILNVLQSEFEHLHVVNHPANRGYGAAIKSAYGFAIENGYDYVLFMDADLTQDPCYIPAFLPYMLNGTDFIKASRYIRGSRTIGVPLFRVAISLLGNAFARFAFHLPITDYTNGFRAVRTSVAKQFRLEANHFEILVEEMWQAKFFAKSFAEVTYSLSSRLNTGDSKFNYSFRIYGLYLKYCFYSLLGIRPHIVESKKDD